MNAAQRIQLLLHGELPQEEADRLRSELAESPALQAALAEQMEFDALISVAAQQRGQIVRLPDSPPRTPQTPKPARMRRWGRKGAAALAAAVLAVAVASVAVQRGLGPGASTEQDLAEFAAAQPSRPVAVRVSRPSLDVYVPYEPALSRGELVIPPPLKLLRSLEAAGDEQAIGMVYLLTGNLDLARAHLERAPDHPETRNDRAAVALASGHPERAEALLKEVLQQRPELAQAWWNLGWALEMQGKLNPAVAAFESAAERSAPKWREAAERRIRLLQEQSR